MAHRIDGRKLSRKQGPRLALYKNLTVSVLRYERIRTTEAKAKEVRGRVEHMITLAKRGDLTARRAVISEFPNEPLVVNKLFDELAPKYADRTSGYTRIIRLGQRLGDAAPRSCNSSSSEQNAFAERRPRRAYRHGSNMTARTLPGSRRNLELGRSKGSSRPRSPG